MTNTKTKWLETDEAIDVVASLRHASLCFELARTDTHALKWAFLALHSGLQGACVCHLTTTASPIGALTNESTKNWVEYLNKSRTDSGFKAPETRVLALPDLLKAVRKECSAGNRSEHKRIEITDEELSWIKALHGEIRNQFTHFAPRGWTVEVSGIPKFARLIARITTQILEAGWGFRHLDSEQRNDLQRSLVRLSTL